MRYREWAGARLPVSMVGLGAAPLGDVYGPVDLGSATRAVRTALDMGVNIVDVAPYYGATRAETVLGKALAGVDRESYLLATKVSRYGLDAFDFSAERVRRSVDESLGSLQVIRYYVIGLISKQLHVRPSREPSFAEI